MLPALKFGASLSSIATQLPWAVMSSGSVGAVCSQEGAAGFLHFSTGRTRCLAARKRKANIKISNKVVLFSPWPCVGVSLSAVKARFLLPPLGLFCLSCPSSPSACGPWQNVEYRK